MDRTQTIIEIVKAASKGGEVPGLGESLFETGYLDSFALPDVVTELEKQFKIKIPDSDLNPRKFDSIERIDRYVSQAQAVPKA